MDNFCHTHYENHLEKTCPEFINSFKAMLLPREPHQEQEEEEKEEAEKVEPSLSIHLIWVDTEMDDIGDDITIEFQRFQTISISFYFT